MIRLTQTRIGTFSRQSRMASFHPSAIHLSLGQRWGSGFRKSPAVGLPPAFTETVQGTPTTATEIAHAAVPAVKREAEEEWGKGAVAIILKEKSPRLRAGDRLRFACSFYCFLVVLVSAAAHAVVRRDPTGSAGLGPGAVDRDAVHHRPAGHHLHGHLLLTGISLVLPLILPLARVALVLRHFVVLHVLSTNGQPTGLAMRSGKSTRCF